MAGKKKSRFRGYISRRDCAAARSEEQTKSVLGEERESLLRKMTTHAVYHRYMYHQDKAWAEREYGKHLMTEEEFYNRNLLRSETTICGKPLSEVVTMIANSEVDPDGTAPNQPGAKLDAGKAPIFRGALSYFPRALAAVAEVSDFGATKYTWKGWETVPDGYNRYSDAMVRHAAKEGTGEVLDPDSGRLHAAHCAWNSLARLELFLRDIEVGKVKISG